ncbi:MAG: metalloprotease [Haloferacaceae archaeon]
MGAGRVSVARGIEFTSRELLDLAVAWGALGVAFALFFAGGGNGLIRLLSSGPGTFALAVGVSLVTAGVAFLCHELGHKVVATRFGRIAHFRADYGMLFVAVLSALAGFLFAAPGAVYHSGRNSTAREHGLIALAGPAVNVALAVLFVPAFLVGGGLVELVGARGVAINLFLAAFNLVPFGGLDGKTVKRWSTVVWAGTFVSSAILTVVVVFVLGVGL